MTTFGKYPPITNTQTAILAPTAFAIGTGIFGKLAFDAFNTNSGESQYQGIEKFFDEYLNPALYSMAAFTCAVTAVAALGQSYTFFTAEHHID